MTEETSGLGWRWQYAGAGRGSLSLCLERWRELGAAGVGGAWFRGGRSGGCWLGLGQQEAGSGYGVWGEDLGRGQGCGRGLEAVVTGADRGQMSECLGCGVLVVFSFSSGGDAPGAGLPRGGGTAKRCPWGADGPPLGRSPV